MKPKVEILLNKSPFHRVFIMEAIKEYTTNVLKNKEQVIKELNEQGLINGEDWIQIAEDCNTII